MKRIFALILTAILLLSAFPFVSVNAGNGICGETATWEFDSELGVLYVSGNGDMTDYEKGSDVPWYHYRNSILQVSVADGITHIGKNAFRNLEKLTTAKLSSTLKTIGENAFAYCYTLNNISIPSTLEAIGESAFYQCKALKEVTVPNGVTAIEKDTFFGCQALVSVKMGDSVKTIGDGAFYFCVKLSNLKLSASLESIGLQAFEYCEELKVFTCMMNDKDWEDVDIADGNDYLVNAKRFNGELMVGDTDNNGIVEASDAIHLLYNIFFGNDRYPITQDCDFNNDSTTSTDDAIYLLYHVFFGAERYPLIH